MATGDWVMLFLGIAAPLGFHCFARWAERDHQQQLERETLGKRPPGDALAWEQSAMKDALHGENG